MVVVEAMVETVVNEVVQEEVEAARVCEAVVAALQVGLVVVVVPWVASWVDARGRETAGKMHDAHRVESRRSLHGAAGTSRLKAQHLTSSSQDHDALYPLPSPACTMQRTQMTSVPRAVQRCQLLQSCHQTTCRLQPPRHLLGGCRRLTDTR